MNSWENNALRGIEILNLNARVQAQVLAAVQTCIQEGINFALTNHFIVILIHNCIINAGGSSRADLLEQSADLSEAFQYYSRRIEFALQDAQRQMDLLRLRIRMSSLNDTFMK